MIERAKGNRGPQRGHRPKAAFLNRPAMKLPVIDASSALRAALSPRDRRVLAEVVLALATGHPPKAAELAARLRLPIHEVEDALHTLEDRGLIALEGDEIRVAYPFTAEHAPYNVVSSRGVAHACCAIDALGAGAMLRETIEVQSRCARCGARINLRGRQRFEGTPEGVVVFVPTSGVRDGRAIDVLCPSINFYCSREHGAAHVGAWADRGRFLSLEEATRMAIKLFGDLLAGPV